MVNRLSQNICQDRAPFKVILKRKTGVSSENKIEVFFKRGDQLKGQRIMASSQQPPICVWLSHVG
jgi:hypothetical protein